MASLLLLRNVQLTTSLLWCLITQSVGYWDISFWKAEPLRSEIVLNQYKTTVVLISICWNSIDNLKYLQHFLSKSTWAEQPVEDFSNFTCICVYVFIYVFVSRLLAKRKTIQTWNLVQILPWTLFRNWFFVFPKKWPWGGELASKNCRVTWILRISLIALFYLDFVCCRNLMQTV